MDKKKVICLKCKKSFMSEMDSRGIPYSKICSNCKKNNKKIGRGVSSSL
jgi:DNA-directed RNA polymerase subunit RPC12/RpoP